MRQNKEKAKGGEYFRKALYRQTALIQEPKSALRRANRSFSGSLSVMSASFKILTGFRIKGYY